MRNLVVVTCFLIFQTCVAFAQQTSTPPQEAAATQIDIPKYPDSSDGLKQLLTTLMEAAKNNDQRTFAAYAESLRLPSPLFWFQSVFGDELGAELAEAQKGLRGNLQLALFESISNFLTADFSELRILRFKDPCEPATAEQFHSILLMRRKQIPFYLPLFAKRKETAGRTLGFFAFVDGAFRFLGAIRLREREHGNLLGVVEKVQRTKILDMVPPVYPEVARMRFLQGTVRLQAVIGFEGRVQDLRVLYGPCVLAQAALDAVRQWRYSPTLVNSQPVQVLTTIDVVFALGRR